MSGPSAGDRGQSQPDRPPVREILADRRRRRLERLEAAERHLPITFSLVGVQKAATSTLYRMLVRHPDVVGGPEKEMRFFDDESRDWDNPDYSDYKRPCTSPNDRWAGDATPSYFFWPRALQRMQAYDPDMRLLLSVRDPVERAMSQWSMQRDRDPAFPDVSDALRLWGRMEVSDDWPEGVEPVQLRTTSLFARGRYGQQLARGLSLFAREQWCIVDFHEVVTDPQRALARVTDLLGIDRFVEPPPLKRRNATRSDHQGRLPTAHDVEELVQWYADDLADFARLSGLDVSDWPTARVISGRESVEELTDSLVRKLGLTS